MGFALASLANAIALCGTCQPQFDCALDPRFVFIPTDLDYFIDFELEDRQRRRAAAEKGVLSDRLVPTAEMYKLHEMTNGEIGTMQTTDKSRKR